MKITDKEVIGLLDKHRLYELDAMLEDYPENERDGRTDMEMFKNELEYLLERYTWESGAMCQDLEWAREVLRMTKHGKVMPLFPETLNPMFKKTDITAAKEVVNEYNRTKAMARRLGMKA